MGDDRAQRGGRPGGRVALGFALAALAASWNPVAAPFGLVVGLAAALLAWRALRRVARTAVAAAALVVALAAVVASIAILALTAGAVGVDLPGEQVVKGRTSAELDQVLSQAAERTRAERERARHELDALAGERRDGGKAAVPGAADRARGRADAGPGDGR
jgi:hypothetical protein